MNLYSDSREQIQPKFSSSLIRFQKFFFLAINNDNYLKCIRVNNYSKYKEKSFKNSVIEGRIELEKKHFAVVSNSFFELDVIKIDSFSC